MQFCSSTDTESWRCKIMCTCRKSIFLKEEHMSFPCVYVAIAINNMISMLFSESESSRPLKQFVFTQKCCLSRLYQHFLCTYISIICYTDSIRPIALWIRLYMNHWQVIEQQFSTTKVEHSKWFLVGIKGKKMIHVTWTAADVAMFTYWNPVHHSC